MKKNFRISSKKQKKKKKKKFENVQKKKKKKKKKKGASIFKFTYFCFADIYLDCTHFCQFLINFFVSLQFH